MYYVTMTVCGMRGYTFYASSDEAATAEAEHRGYVVLDVIDGDGEDDADTILVVADNG